MATNLTLAGLKKRLDKNLTAEDEELQDYLDSALEQAQQPPPYGCGRQLVALDGDDPVQLRIRVHGGRFVRIPDGRQIDEVLVDDVATDEYETSSRNGLITRLEVPEDCDVVKVTGRFGFSPIPPSLRDAIYVLAARYYYERGAQYADQVEVLEGTAVQAYYRQLPPRTKLVFGSFTIPSDVMGVA